MITVVIVDDEVNAVKNLKWELEEFCKDVQVMDTFTSPHEAISAINYLKPDVVFLDIEMPEIDGFEVLDSLHYRDFYLIITSAHESYAIKAFRKSAVDYLLKPVDTDDLIATMERIRVRVLKSMKQKQMLEVLDDLQDIKPGRLVIPLSEKTIYLDTKDIIYCRSDGEVTEIHFSNGKKEELGKSMNEMEDLLGTAFIRIHNSYIAKVKAVRKLINLDGPYVVMVDGTHIPVSQSKKNELLRMLNGRSY